MPLGPSKTIDAATHPGNPGNTAYPGRFFGVPERSGLDFGGSGEGFGDFRGVFFDVFSRVAPTSIEQHAFLKNLLKPRQGR